MWSMFFACAQEPADGADPPTDEPTEEPTGPTGVVTCPPLSVDVGTGDAGFVALEDGDDVTVVHGFQGFNAFHVDV
nr:hypothetical protein [Deltaproteobacteria bacterium]